MLHNMTPDLSSFINPQRADAPQQCEDRPVWIDVQNSLNRTQDWHPLNTFLQPFYSHYAQIRA